MLYTECAELRAASGVCTAERYQGGLTLADTLLTLSLCVHGNRVMLDLHLTGWARECPIFWVLFGHEEM